MTNQFTELKSIDSCDILDTQSEVALIDNALLYIIVLEDNCIISLQSHRPATYRADVVNRWLAETMLNGSPGKFKQLTVKKCPTLMNDADLLHFIIQTPWQDAAYKLRLISSKYFLHFYGVKRFNCTFSIEQFNALTFWTWGLIS